jgi:proteasome assembly chaperone 3
MSTILWTAESEGPLDVARRGVIVGIALRKPADHDELGLGLTPHERSVFQGVMSMLRELLKPVAELQA